MNDYLACDFREAELNNLRDALSMTAAERWRWLQDAMDFGFQVARDHAARGLITLGPQGEILWSAAQEIQWQAKNNKGQLLRRIQPRSGSQRGPSRRFQPTCKSA